MVQSLCRLEKGLGVIIGLRSIGFMGFVGFWII